MQTDGFHYSRLNGQTAYGTPPYIIELSEPVVPYGDVRVWDYHEDIPPDGRNYLYFYSAADIAHLTGKPEDSIKPLFHMFKWRSRTWRDNSTRERQFYLFDVISSLPEYFDGLMESYGHKIDQELLEEARGYVTR